MRLTEVAPVWGRSDWPHLPLRLEYDAKNHGSRVLHLPENGLSHQVEVDGQWYEWVDPSRGVEESGAEHVSKQGVRLLDFGPDAKHEDCLIELAGNWRAIPEGREHDHAARRYSGYCTH